MNWFTISILFLVMILFSCKTDNTTDNSPISDFERKIRMPIQPGETMDTVNVAKLHVLNPNFDFGEINKGDKIDIPIKIQNTGKVELLISDIKTSCGCVVAGIDQDEIPVGDSTTIHINFDSEGLMGYQEKNILILANTFPPNNDIKITGTIKDQ